MRAAATASLAITAALLASCGDEPPAPSYTASARDAGDRGEPDAAIDDRPDSGPGRPDGGAMLPGADLELELPYGGASVTHVVDVQADLGLLDVALSVDTTQSMQNAIDQLQNDLRRVLIDGLRERVPLVSFAVTSFQDFPLPPFGSRGGDGAPPDSPFRLLTAITSNEGAVASAVARLDRPLGRGGDLPESSGEALFQIASGVGYELGDDVLIPPYDQAALEGGGELGGVGFRPNALRVVVQVTDAPSHTPIDYVEDFPGTRSMQDAAEALSSLGARVVGVVIRTCMPAECENPTSNYRQARRDVEQIAIETGGFTDGDDGCPTALNGNENPLIGGVCPLVFDVSADGKGMSDLLVDGIVALIDELSFSAVSASVNDDPLLFVQGIEALPEMLPDAPAVADHLPVGRGDGLAETFVDVRSGTTLRFAVRLRNDRIAPTDVDQRFRLTLRVVGDGLLLREQTLRVVVPAGGPTPSPMDAGSDAAPADDDAGR